MIMWRRRYYKAITFMLLTALFLTGCTESEESTKVDLKANQELLSGNTLTNAEAGILEQEIPEAPLLGELMVENIEETKEDKSFESTEDKVSAVFVGRNGILNSLQLNVHTTGNESGGMTAVMNGEIYATDADIVTIGNKSAGISLYSKESSFTVTGGSADAEGEGSPCLYTEGSLYANRFTGTSARAEMAVVRNGGSINMTNSSLSGNGIVITGKREDDTMATLSFSDTSLILNQNDFLLKATGAKSKIELKNSVLLSEPEALLLAVDSEVILAADQQAVSGNILCDINSQVSVALKNGSSYRGSIDPDNTGDVSISLEGDSAWILTGDSYVTAITDAGELSHITSNGYSIYYDASQEANSWLQGMVINIMDGGKLIPV